MGLFHSRFAVPAHQDGNNRHWGSLLARCGQCPLLERLPYRDNGV